MASVVFNSFKKEIMDGTIDLSTDEVRAQLTNGYDPQDVASYIDNHTRMDDVWGLQASGIKVISVSVTQDNTDDEGVWDSTADLIWTSSTIDASGMLLYCHRDGTAANQNLIGWMDFGAGKSSVTGTFTVQFSGEGILNLT